MTLLKRMWSRYWLRGVQYSGKYNALKTLYRVEDPWNLKSPLETARFKACTSIVKQVAPGCDSLLELGCGEGLQSAWLTQCCRNLTGIDVSEQAVKRARVAVPKGTFMAGQIEDAARLVSGQRFDIAVACEVLYYTKDCGAVLDEIVKLTDILLVTNYVSRFDRIAHHFTGEGWTALDDIVVEDQVWKVNLWRRTNRM